MFISVSVVDKSSRMRARVAVEDSGRTLVWLHFDSLALALSPDETDELLIALQNARQFVDAGLSGDVPAREDMYETVES